MLLPFRVRRFVSDHFVNYNHSTIKGYDYAKHLPARKGNNRFLIEKDSLRKPNNEALTFVIIADADYFILAYEQIQTIFIVEPQSEVFLFDAGISAAQKAKLLSEFPSNVHFETFAIEQVMKENNLRRNEAMFYYKIYAVTAIVSKTKNKFIVYSDAANVFLKPLHELKNYVCQNGFYGGMTEMFGYARIQQYKQFRDCAEDLKVNIYSKRFLLLEGGFWMINTSQTWIQSFLEDYKMVTKKHLGVFQIFPHDMVAMSLLLHKYSRKNQLTFQETPNIRFQAILEKALVKEKNIVVFDYDTEKIPFFGYAVHNSSNHSDAPIKRRCSVYKADINEYIQKK
jgi:hypothetical protein